MLLEEYGADQLDAHQMQTPACISLPSPASPMVSTSTMGVVAGVQDADAPFAAILRGETGIAETKQSIQDVKPALVSLADSAALVDLAYDDSVVAMLPEVAATGKILPVPAKPEADLPVAGDDLTNLDTSITSIAAAQAVALIQVAKPQTDSTLNEMGEAGISAGITHTIANMAAQERQSVSRAIATTTTVANQAYSADAAPPLQAVPATESKSAQVPTSPAAKLDVPPAPLTSSLPNQIQGPIAVSIIAPTFPAPGTEGRAPERGEVIALARLETKSEQPVIAPSANSQLAARAAPAHASNGGASQRESRDHASARRGSNSEVPGAAALLPGTDLSTGASSAVLAMAGRSIHASATTVALSPESTAVMPDRAAAVANVVDRLIAARDAGLGALTSVAIAHREFGELTVNFADKGNALDISVIAADTDSQRALAAALHNAERPISRETPVQGTSSSQHGAASQPQDRGTGSQFARDSGGRQPHGEAMSDRRRTDRAQTRTVEAEAAELGPGGIYV